MGGTLLSLGSINADFQMRVAADAEKETRLASDFCRLPGGKAGNRAYLGALFGLHSELLGRVGDDDLATQALAPVQKAGVDISGVSHAADCGTAVSMITVRPDAKKQIVLAPNANDCWDETAADAMAERIARVSLPACLTVDYEVPAWVVRRAVECARRRQVTVLLDPSFPDRVEHSLLPHLLAITPNVEEAQALLDRSLEGKSAIVAAAREFAAQGVGVACIKLANGGCVVVADGKAWLVPPGDIAPIDTTGAGDAFTGVLAIALLEGRGPLEAALWAVAAANLAVTGYGSQAAYADRSRVEAMARQLQAAVQALDV